MFLERHPHSEPEQELVGYHETDKFKNHFGGLEAKAERMLDAFHS